MKNPFIETTYAVAYRPVTDRDMLLFENSGKTPFSLLPNTWRYWYADPMNFSYQGADWLFVEQMNRLTHRGYIAAARVKNGTIGPFQTVLKEEYHLSYPMVFEKGEHVYMIPESTAGRCVKLYECKHFPDKWEYKATLFENVLYADSTMVFFNEHWYFITGEMDPEMGAKTRTLVFLADEIESGVLTPLESNQSSDFSFEQRGGGSFFKHAEKLYRPIQCGNEKEYGKLLKFTVAQPDNLFKEHEVARVNTSNIKLSTAKPVSGIHSYAKTQQLEIIDVKLEGKTNLPVFCCRVLRRVRGIVR